MFRWSLVLSQITAVVYVILRPLSYRTCPLVSYLTDSMTIPMVEIARVNPNNATR